MSKQPDWSREDVSLHGHMVQEYYVERLREIRARRAKRRAAINTPEGVFRLRRRVQRAVQTRLGPFPKRTPLNVRVAGTVERTHFRIERLWFESRPGVPVTANLYIPRQGRPPYPAVLGLCGHADEGKHDETYQRFAQGLATKGFLTLMIDPIGQGERSHYHAKKPYPYPRACAAQHTALGNPMRLTGDFFGAWRTWDAVRALDVLLDRPEADHRHVGATGNSGGGTLTAYLAAVDERLTMAAPSCFVTTCLHNLENENLADQEQNPPGLWAAGLDMADYFIAHLPRPVLLLGQHNDFFDRRGLEEAYAEIQRLYALAGKAGNIQRFIGPGNHGYSIENREAMYAFFQRCCGMKSDPAEPRLRPLPEPQLYATPGGRALDLPGARPVYTLTREHAQTLARRRPPPDLQTELPRLLKLPARSNPPHYRILPMVNAQVNGRNWYPTRFALETEKGIQAHLHLFDAKEKHYQLPRGRNATVIVAHETSVGEFAEHGARGEADRLFLLDVRGIGVSRPMGARRKDRYAFMQNEYYYASQAQMLGEPVVGRRTHDVLCALDLLTALGYEDVHLAGTGLGAFPATFAACLHPLVRRVTLRNALLSYQELAEDALCYWPLSVLLPDVLRRLDLPDCYRCLQDKNLRILHPWNAHMRPWPDRGLREHLTRVGLDFAMRDETPMAPRSNR